MAIFNENSVPTVPYFAEVSQIKELCNFNIVDVIEDPVSLD